MDMFFQLKIEKAVRNQAAGYFIDHQFDNTSPEFYHFIENRFFANWHSCPIQRRGITA